MLLQCNATLAWRCPLCGELELNQISIFDFSGKNRLEIKCGCGYTKLVFGKSSSKKYWLEYACVVCESTHRVSFTQGQFWVNRVKKIKCLDNGAELGYLGPYEDVKRLADQEEEYLRLMIDKLEFEDYFNNPEIMLSVLNELHDIAEANGLVCQCGSSDIDIDMLPREIRLTCNRCHGVTRISAETKEDLAFLRKIKQIKILEGVVSALEGINL
ncbi:hypothetical protein U472_15185 [Orenia metallireducens]|jgi:hypothetical protein|uniref:Uncharacterized protein n=1 Tax=Orenia metallireducens TaxID=1413210 RepID=A0A1C0A695_9FIRM|nr:hypothetical protein [Orenia metallireducens]OCL25672.1 hypothetical protein U472_15185 [Orenia metallireducens]